MKQVILTRGLPGSGKSTWAKAWVAKSPTTRVRVNKDDLREMMHNGKFSKGNESSIIRLEEALIIDAIAEDKSVVVDNTHLVDKHFNRINQLVKNVLKVDYEVIYKDFLDISPEECIKRDLLRARSVGQNVIWRMYWDHVAVIATPEFKIGKPKAVIFDVDGTIAEKGNRSPYDWNKVVNDKPRLHIIKMLQLYYNDGYSLIGVTGRDGICYEQTADWISKNSITYKHLFSRAPSDSRPDYVVKKELYINHIEPHYNVELVVDDRPQVIREWRRLGLNTINANPIDLDF